MIEIKKASNDAVKYACTHFHYAKSVPQTIYAYNAYQDKEWCGCVVYGYGANYNIHKSFEMNRGEVAELERVALNGKQNHTSEIVAASLKQLRKDAPQIKIVVSYADIDQGHAGIIYQATNWIYLGESGGGKCGAFIVHNRKMHPKSVYSRGWKDNIQWLRDNIDANAEEFITKGKRKYIFVFDKKERRKWLAQSKPYPKNNV